MILNARRIGMSWFARILAAVFVAEAIAFAAYVAWLANLWL
jgi:hypothetical protein